MKIIGHRGARGLAPENTIAGLQKGVACHVDELEFDLRVTSDGVVILNHNPMLEGDTQPITSQTYAQLKARKPDMPTFDEVLDAVGRKTPLHIEVKRGEPTDAIIEILKTRLAHGWKSEDFRVASRSVSILKTFQYELPDIERVVIEIWSGVRATWKARQVNTHRISMLDYWLWPGFISSMTKGGYKLYAFPPQYPDKERLLARVGLGGAANNPVKAKKWAAHGLAGVFTDYPDRFKT